MKFLLLSVDKYVVSNTKAFFAMVLLMPFLAAILFNVGVIHDVQQVRCLEWSWYLKNGLSMPGKGDYAMLDGIYVAKTYPQNVYFYHAFFGKRIVAVGGDHVVVSHTGVDVNGQHYGEGLPLASTFYHLPEEHFYRQYDLRDGQYFVMASHPYSNDSRYFGPVPKVAVIAQLYPLK